MFIDTNEIGYELRAVRKHYKVKGQHVSKRARLHLQYIYQIESGKNKVPRLEQLLAICNVLNDIRKEHRQSFKQLREELGENLVIDIMEMLDKKKNR